MPFSAWSDCGGLLQVYTQSETGSQVVNTAWAMLALLAAELHLQDAKPLHRAAKYLLAAQLPSGDWPQQAISGVFNRNCMITYSNYRYSFSVSLDRRMTAVLE